MTIMTVPQIAREAANSITAAIGPVQIDKALVLGSGFKSLATLLKDPKSIAFKDIAHMPLDNLQGHGQELIFGKLGDQNLMIFTGRLHYYQGHPIEMVALPAWIAHELGCKEYIFTNAAGGVNPKYHIGQMTLIQDHINLTGLNPLRGIHVEGKDNPFFDTSTLYHQGLRESLIQKAETLGMELKQGVYCFLPGPNFETPAEINMLRCLGIDLVGMSSVPEALVAHQLGMQVLGLSVVTNVYPEKNQVGTQVTHQEVLQATDQSISKLKNLLTQWMQI